MLRASGVVRFDDPTAFVVTHEWQLAKAFRAARAMSRLTKMNALTNPTLPSVRERFYTHAQSPVK
jgi:hypothetical protein